MLLTCIIVIWILYISLAGSHNVIVLEGLFSWDQIPELMEIV